jgi:hypothetical protein
MQILDQFGLNFFVGLARDYLVPEICQGLSVELIVNLSQVLQDVFDFPKKER